MSMSIYYAAARPRPLTQGEIEQVEAVELRFSVDDQIESYLRTGRGPNWESFTIYPTDDLTQPGIVLEGATRLPDNSEDALWIGVQHWCRALTALRRILQDAQWQVHVDDHDIHWDERTQSYDPST